MKQYFINLILAGSRMFNTVLLGNPNMSFSQRVGHASNGCSNWFIESLKWTIDGIFYLIFDEKNHVDNALKGESNGKELWSWCGEDK